MVNSVMYPPLKLTLLKNRLYLTAVISAAFFIALALVLTTDSCGLDYVDITNAIKVHELYMKPESCEELVEKILLFNDKCSPHVEIVDCG